MNYSNYLKESNNVQKLGRVDKSISLLNLESNLLHGIFMILNFSKAIGFFLKLCCLFLELSHFRCQGDAFLGRKSLFRFQGTQDRLGIGWKIPLEFVSLYLVEDPFYKCQHFSTNFLCSLRCQESALIFKFVFICLNTSYKKKQK